MREGKKRGREKKEVAMWSVLKLRNSADIKKPRPRSLSASVRSACSDAMQVALDFTSQVCLPNLYA